MEIKKMTLSELEKRIKSQERTIEEAWKVYHDPEDNYKKYAILAYYETLHGLYKEYIKRKWNTHTNSGYLGFHTEPSIWDTRGGIKYESKK